ncbi:MULTISPECIES: pyruvate dehydrogenase (acetyl-transferring) E1 component subunit alpha [Thermoflexus]|jgi:2-oxoisovalerate dehydrogenase E1 component|uniref:pyruvate dehydrogenase (acetyl-transferring) E1 component subunit alpha n=1 Tax=Thermoflexus TaxID=1495649 RepID=UPI0026F06241|nr:MULTISPECIES: pyruvate dehydrogenase (acetyl-transferring) E1 component subunit alpha [Thermoflexus]
MREAPTTSLLDATLDLPRERLIDWLYQMLLIRAFEETVEQLYAAGKMHGTMHLYIGQEAVAVGAIAALRPDDYITSTHRGHGHAIAKGQDLRAMLAELLGKETGVCRGRGGSMHLADLERGNLGANGIVAGGIPIAVGAGLSIRMQGQDRVVLCFFGDGAANHGNFHEGLNMAAIWRLPVVFLCENNQYAMSMAVRRAMAVPRVADRAVAYGIPGETVDGMDVVAVYRAVRAAVERARRGEGPTLIEAITYRYRGHSKSDRQVYRTKDEVQAWMARDPIARLREALIARGWLSEAEAAALEERAREAVAEALRAAEGDPEPDVAQLTEGVYAEDPLFPPRWIRQAFGSEVPVEPPAGTRELSYAEALREAMAQAMAADERVFLMGEDIGVYGGAFGVTQGLIERFGPERVRDTPISENTIVGAGVGAALTGMRPIVEMQFMDFVTLAMEQTVLQAAKVRYMFGGKARVPLVLRLPGGSGTGAAAQHSESLEAWFVHVPGLKVVAPATPYDAKGLLLAALADDNPVIFVEHKLLYRTRGPVPEEPYLVPLGKAAVRRPGRHLTIVAYSIAVLRALEAAERLAAEGIEAEVIDLRTLKPYDAETVIASVKKTGKLLIVHEAPLLGGFGGELAAAVAQSEAFAYLEAPIVRLGGADVPIPYHPRLERAAVPQVEDIVEAARRLARLEI